MGYTIQDLRDDVEYMRGFFCLGGMQEVDTEVVYQLLDHIRPGINADFNRNRALFKSIAQNVNNIPREQSQRNIKEYSYSVFGGVADAKAYINHFYKVVKDHQVELDPHESAYNKLFKSTGSRDAEQKKLTNAMSAWAGELLKTAIELNKQFSVLNQDMVNLMLLLKSRGITTW